jgi:3-hydroxyisobutyrate dehydrogenase-like beta-hydroxyacid dehydrogenase
MIKTVGVVGLGKMGLPMARHLIARGFTVCGFDPFPPAIEAAAHLGVEMPGTLRAVAAMSDLVLVVVGFDDEVHQVLRAEDGLLAGARPGTVIAVASTVTPGTMQEIAEAARVGQVEVLDVPMCRGEPAAEAGKLLVMVGGDKVAFERCRPALSAFADSIFHLGDVGAGQVGKMINNLLLWAAIAANTEGLKLADSLGVEPEALRQALLLSSGNNWALETWAQPRAMPWAEKDMAIVMQEADRARLSLPLCGVIREVIKGIKIERGLPPPPLH